jgi:hypothetical protein
MPTPTKPVWQSKTLAVNGLILVLAVLDAAQALPVPATWAPYLIAAASVLNVVLRLTTNTGLSVGTGPAYRAAHEASGDPDLPPDTELPTIEGLPAWAVHPQTPAQQRAVEKWRASLTTPDEAMRAQRSGTSGGTAPTTEVPDRAPSLMETLAADNGIDPKDITPEDTV